jgi:outer membrane lipoprotein-sorting protein
MPQTQQSFIDRHSLTHRLKDGASFDQCLRRVADHRLTQKCEKLFRRIRPEAASGPGGDENGGELHPVRQAQTPGQVNRSPLPPRKIASPVVNAAGKAQIAAMINRRTALFTGLSILGLQAMTRGAAAQTTAQDAADLARIEAYLNGIRSLKARFIQSAPNGGISQGVALLQRPGRMRFQYDPPTPYLLVANHGVLVFRDSQLNQTSNIPLSRTPLGILLGDRVALSGEVTVTKLVRLPGQLQVSLVRTASPGEGTLTLIFADNPLSLRQWVVLDQQGKQTRVAFTNMEVGANLDANQFEFHDPGQYGGGG